MTAPAKLSPLPRRGKLPACAAFAGLLSMSMILPANLQAEPARPSRHTSPTTGPLTPEQRTLHALDRFTFGPRPGEVAAVGRMGLDAWFQQQLHPESLPDTGLEQRLSAFPAMQLSQAELIQRFPPPALLRRMNDGNWTPPQDPTGQAIWADAGYFIQERREARQQAKVIPASAANTEQAATMASQGDGGDEAQATPVDTDALLAMPPEARFARIVALSPAQFRATAEMLRGPQQMRRLTAGFTPAQTEDVMAMRSPEQLVQSEVASTRLLRDVYSQRQLQAVMTDFWLNHFSVYLHKNQNEPYLLPAYQRETVLPNALGSFEDLLVATAKSPAMLVYLDNWESVGPDSRAAARQTNNPNAPQGKKGARGINENYARELMELHTLGVNGGYTQQDVIEVAKCFTGWTVDNPGQGGTFVFNPNRHEPGPKTVLGHVIPESGMNEGLEVLHILATSPATAHFVSLKLAQRFVGDDPPPALVARMARTFQSSGGDTKAVLTTLWRSPEFWSPATYRGKVKTPGEFLASALRATDAQVTDARPLVQAINRLGMPVYGMQTPNGYSWQSEDWVSSNALLTRMNLALVLAGNRLQGTTIDWATLLPPTASDAPTPDAAVEARLEHDLLGQPAAPNTRTAALGAAQTPGVPLAVNGSPATSLTTMAGLLLGSPDFQRR